MWLLLDAASSAAFSSFIWANEFLSQLFQNSKFVLITSAQCNFINQGKKDSFVSCLPSSKNSRLGIDSDRVRRQEHFKHCGFSDTSCDSKHSFLKFIGNYWNIRIMYTVSSGIHWWLGKQMKMRSQELSCVCHLASCLCVVIYWILFVIDQYCIFYSTINLTASISIW